MKLSGEILINVPASDVWHILAHQFDRIGEWSSGIEHSSPNLKAIKLDDAPMAGRVCDVPAFGKIEETFIAYDEQAKTYTYEARVGLPFFVTSAQNSWQVNAIDANTCSVRFDAELTLIPFVGVILAIPMRIRLARIIKNITEELKYYAETGAIHPRKQRLIATATT
ncbi:MAG: SRPBCC family protein [Chloroflexota bacterium]